MILRGAQNAPSCPRGWGVQARGSFLILGTKIKSWNWTRTSSRFLVCSTSKSSRILDWTGQLGGRSWFARSLPRSRPHLAIGWWLTKKKFGYYLLLTLTWWSVGSRSKLTFGCFRWPLGWIHGESHLRLIDMHSKYSKSDSGWLEKYWIRTTISEIGALSKNCPETVH